MEVTCGGMQVKRRVGSYTNARVAENPSRTGGHYDQNLKLGNGSLPRTGSFQIATPPSASHPITATCSGSLWTCPSQIKHSLHCTKTVEGRRRLASARGGAGPVPSVRRTWVHVTLSLADCRHRSMFTLPQPIHSSVRRFCVFGLLQAFPTSYKDKCAHCRP